MVNRHPLNSKELLLDPLGGPGRYIIYVYNAAQPTSAAAFVGHGRSNVHTMWTEIGTIQTLDEPRHRLFLRKKGEYESRLEWGDDFFFVRLVARKRLWCGEMLFLRFIDSTSKHIVARRSVRRAPIQMDQAGESR